MIIENEQLLLIGHSDEKAGLHYNLPGGGVEPGESMIEALSREVKEETTADIEAGDLVFALEYEPKRNSNWAGSTRVMNLVFEGRIVGDTVPRLPIEPDPNQMDVKWVGTQELEGIEVLPHLTEQLIEYIETGKMKKVFWEEPVDPKRAFKYIE